MVLYHFKAVVGLFHSKSVSMGHTRILPELRFHEDKKFRAQNNAICDCKCYTTFIVHWISA